MGLYNLNLLYRQTLEVIKLAAAPADIQLDQFPSQVCRPDEVAFTIDEIVGHIDLLVDNNMILEKTAKRIKRLNNFYSTFNKQDWTEKAMSTSENWEKTRRLAKEIMYDSDLNFEIPNLFWIKDISTL